MRNNIIVGIIMLAYIVSWPKSVLASDAFPGAVGVGKNSIGGRGGQVIHVTNLNDSGTGSLRAALATQGARIIVFDVSGNINLTSLLYVTNPYVTIAGQTSPGGVAVSGKQFNVATHDVIIRHMRFRSGGLEYEGADSDGDSCDILGPNWNDGTLVYNVILDHCSFTWGTDESLSISGGATATTVQKCLIAKGLNYAKDTTSRHSKGLMVSGKFNYDTEVSLYKNYIATNDDRNPMIWNPFGCYNGDPNECDNIMRVDAHNNVSYNYYHGNRPMIGGYRIYVNWMNNWAKEGPLSNRYDAFASMTELIANADPPYPMIYVLGNYGVNKETGELFGGGTTWLVADEYYYRLASSSYQSDTQFVFDPAITSSALDGATALAVVADSGATVPVRDAVDQEIVEDYTNNEGEIPDSVTLDDWPTYSNNPVPADTDNDGMPDSWEDLKGLNKTINDSTLYSLNNDYTNIEVYLNELADSSGPTCFDGIQNGDETGVDCGGSCAACSPSVITSYGAIRAIFRGIFK